QSRHNRLGFFFRGQRLALAPDFFQFIRIEPETAATWTLINHDLSQLAVVVPHQHYVDAFGARTLLLIVHFLGRITWNGNLNVLRYLLRGGDLLQFECIEPNASAAPTANVEHHAPDHQLTQTIATCWTDHGKILRVVHQVTRAE